MTTPSKEGRPRENEKLRKELEELRRRVEAAESTVDAIRGGQVDAVVVSAERETVLLLENADRPYRLLVDHKAEPAAVLDCDGTILSYNGHFAHLLEQPPDSLLGSPLSAHTVAADRTNADALLRAAKEGSAEGSLELRRADGRPVPVYWSISLVHEGAAGECLLVTDLTQRKVYEERQHRADQFETLINEAPIGVFLVDSDFRITQVNPIAQPFFEGFPGGVVGREFEEALRFFADQARVEEVIGIFRRTLATGEAFATPGPQPYKREGEIRGYLEWRVNRITFADGRLGLVCYISDVTSHVQAREALKEADRRKDEFLAMLAHELRNPLAPIRNALSVLNVAGGDREAADRSRKMLGRQVEQITRLVDDLLDVNRITRGALDLRKTQVELASIVHQAIGTIRPLADRASQKLTATLPPRAIYLTADPIRLSQILCNLLNNACKFTPFGGTIELTAERQDNDVIISVRDTGIGIPPEKLGAVFEMFSQVRGPLEESRGGLGIGLTLVKRLVELHGGTVVARSQGIGRGSEFVVRLPLGSDDAPRREHTGGLKLLKTTAKRRVLVVDDNRDNAESLAMLLQLSGHEAEVAADGWEAIEAAERYKPDVILLDIGLPKLNGYEACRLMREQPWGRRAMIFALTGWGQEEDRRKSREAGFDGHLVKPVDHRDLMDALALQST